MIALKSMFARLHDDASMFVKSSLTCFSSSARQKSEGCPIDVAGFPRDLLLTMLQNIDGRRRFIEQHPLLGKLLNERAFSQDDVELEWSSLVFIAKYKPTAETCLSRLRSADVLAALRASPFSSLKVHLTPRRKPPTPTTREARPPRARTRGTMGGSLARTLTPCRI